MSLSQRSRETTVTFSGANDSVLLPSPGGSSSSSGYSSASTSPSPSPRGQASSSSPQQFSSSPSPSAPPCPPQLSRKSSSVANAVRRRYIGAIFDDELSVTRHIRSEGNCTSPPFAAASAVRRRVGIVAAEAVRLARLAILQPQRQGRAGAEADRPSSSTPLATENEAAPVSSELDGTEEATAPFAPIPMVAKVIAFSHRMCAAAKAQLDDDGRFAPLVAVGLCASIFFVK